MKWVAISGTWKTTTPEVEADVRSAVRGIMARGDGIVAGGALGVDYFATDEALKHDAGRIKIILPTALDTFRKHFLKRAAEGVISFAEANALIGQLDEVRAKNPAAITEMHFAECNPQSYFARNGEIVRAADELQAFQVNGSQGTQDTMDKAAAMGKPVACKRYTLEPESGKGR